MSPSSTSASSVSLNHGQNHPLTPIVYSIAALFFLASAYNTLSTTFTPNARSNGQRQRRKRQSNSEEEKSKAKEKSSSTAHSTTIIPNPNSKSTSNSIVTATYLVTPEMCSTSTYNSISTSSSTPFLRAGPLLKLIDICAGISSRRHSSTLCVTISVDSVLILKPVYLGELIHISSCVNRAWNTSLEVGVRVLKEDNHGLKEYVSHAYLTFVSLPKSSKDGEGRFKPPKGVKLNQENHGNSIETTGTHASSSRDQSSNSSSSSSSLFQYLFYQPSISDKASSPTASPSNQASPKPTLPKIIPSTRLEKRRHLLAGIRRSKRISDSKKGETRDGVSTKVKESVKKEVMEMGQEISKIGRETGRKSLKESDEEIDRFESEFIARAFLASDPAVTIDRTQVPSQVIVTLEGDEPLRRNLDEVEKAIDRFREEMKSQNPMLDLTTPSLKDQDVPSEGQEDETKRGKRRVSLGPLSPTFDQSEESKGRIGSEISSVNFKRDSSLKNSQRGRNQSIDSSHWSWEKPFVSGGGVNIGLSSDSNQNDSSYISQESFEGDIRKEQIGKNPDFGMRDWIPVEETLARSVQLVFPEHANSASVLFGGQLMAWMESCAILSCLKLFSSTSSNSKLQDHAPLSSYDWSTVSMDSLTFQKAASIGEVMEFTSIITKTFSRSCEVYVLVTAESQEEGKRFTNDVLLTLACSALGSASGEKEGLMREVRIERETHPALWEFSNVARDRREARLEMRELLSSIYK